MTKNLPQDKSQHCSLVLVWFLVQQGTLLYWEGCSPQCGHFLASSWEAILMHVHHLGLTTGPVSREIKLKILSLD